MPTKDPEKLKQIRRNYIAKGYGKALYRKRQAIRNNERILRRSVELAIQAIEDQEPYDALRLLQRALIEAPPPKSPTEYLHEIQLERGDT